ncbi:MAG: hypothetical protein QOJ54_3240 [Aliidongia sp.]|jgi:hypothetical protein|nr:hypothetical protein [Aliidongia sp.]
MFVKPAPGLQVRFENSRTRFLAEQGEAVPDDDVYWARRLAHGDVVAAEPPKPAVEPSAPVPPVAQAAAPTAVPVPAAAPATVQPPVPPAAKAN